MRTEVYGRISEGFQMNIRVIENDVYLPVLKELIAEGREVRLNVRGSSMLPFLADRRDSVIIARVDSELKKGDIVIFQRKTGEYIMHRICRADKAAKQYYLVGDAQSIVEGPVGEEQIFGVITSVCRKGKWVKPGDMCWWFYDKVWGMMRPFRMKLLLMLLKIRRAVKKV